MPEMLIIPPAEPVPANATRRQLTGNRLGLWGIGILSILVTVVLAFLLTAALGAVAVVGAFDVYVGIPYGLAVLIANMVMRRKIHRAGASVAPSGYMHFATLAQIASLWLNASVILVLIPWVLVAFTNSADIIIFIAAYLAPAGTLLILASIPALLWRRAVAAEEYALLHALPAAGLIRWSRRIRVAAYAAVLLAGGIYMLLPLVYPGAY